MVAAPDARALRGRVRALEDELLRTRRDLAELAPGEEPALLLLCEVAGQLVALPGLAVREIVWFVELTPVPAAPAAVLGGFLYRGEPALALDLARLSGVTREPALEAQLVILGASTLVAAVVDSVRSLVHAPFLGGAAEESGPLPAGYLAGVCRHEGKAIPVLAPEALARVAAGGVVRGSGR